MPICAGIAAQTEELRVACRVGQQHRIVQALAGLHLADEGAALKLSVKSTLLSSTMRPTRSGNDAGYHAPSQVPYE